ncbi:hypothetical protein VTK26DRAFT_7309 [Humicola hyalothermophila]
MSKVSCGYNALPGKTDDGFDRLKAQGYFNLQLAPTAEEACSPHDIDTDWEVNDEDGNEDEDEDYSLIQGRELRSSARGRVFDEFRRH